MNPNNPYIVSARKYRPATFGSVVGQDALTGTLKNAVSSGRLAQAYLFCGPRGVGKTSCARIFAKRINCLSPTPDGEACGVCESCKSIEEGSSFNIVELDAASNNSVDDIRNLTEQVTVPPQRGKYRVFIIDEVHMLTSSAFNAFLKTLEEPPSYVVFILATTEKHKVIPTILSRCQIYDFRRITIDDMAHHLAYVAGQEGIEAEPAALSIIAQKADGAMRDALSIFDQVAAAGAGKVTYEKTIASLNVLDYGYYFRLTEAFRAGNVAEALLIYKEIRDAGFDSQFFINGLAGHVRDLMVASDPATAGLLEVGEGIAQRYTQLAQSMPLSWYYAAMRILNEADLNYRVSGNKQLLVELALIRLCGQGKETAAPAPLPKSKTAPAAPAPSQPAPSAGKVAEERASYGNQKSQSSGSSSHGTAKTAPGVHRGVALKGGVHKAAPAVMSLKERRKKEDNTGDSEADSPPPAAERNSPYTKESFMEAWRRFTELHPELPLLCTAMLASEPIPLAADSFAICVASTVQASTFEPDIHILVDYLRDELSNDRITIGIKEVKSQSRPRKLMPAEQLRKVIEDNPALGELLKNMDAELV